MFCVVWIQQRRVLRLLRINPSYCQISPCRCFWQFFSHRNEKCVNYRATSTAMKKDYLRGAGLRHRYFGTVMRWRAFRPRGNVSPDYQRHSVHGSADGLFPLLFRRGYSEQAYSPQLIAFVPLHRDFHAPHVHAPSLAVLMLYQPFIAISLSKSDYNNSTKPEIWMQP